MNQFRILCVQFLLLVAIAFPMTAVAAEPPDDSKTMSAGDGDWPWWRGPERNGHADPDQDPPIIWSESENIVWQTPLSGRGHGSPIVVGSRVLLPTSDDESETRSVVCIDRETGEVLWQSPVHRGSPTPPRNQKGTQASSTLACDGERIFANFLHDGAAWISALTLEGDPLWQRRMTDYVVHQAYGSSPAIYGPLVIVSADNKSGGIIAGLDRVTGDVVWQHGRPAMPNYPSPVILDVAGRTQLLMTGCERVASFDPLSGDQLWETAGATTECVTSTITDGQLIYTSGGYPRNHVAAIRGDGSQELVWENGTRVYVPSMVVKDEHLYAVADAGIAYCWHARTGREIWKARIEGTFSSSPVLVGDRLYVTNEAGETYIFTASHDGFELLGKNQLGDICFATPAISNGRIYHRVAHRDDEGVREMLYCIGR